MYHGEAAILQNSINMFFQNAKDLRIKQLANCFLIEKAFDNTEDKHANIEEIAEFDIKVILKT
jgi:hypothetical protein